MRASTLVAKGKVKRGRRGREGMSESELYQIEGEEG